MTASALLTKRDSSTAFTITLASLATTSSGTGRQTTAVTNSSNRPAAIISGQITTGTSPTVNKLISIYWVHSDGTYRDDSAGASDAAITIANADLVKTLVVTASSNTAYPFSFAIGSQLNPIGAELILAVVQDTGVNLHATGGNHVLKYEFIYPEAQ